MADSTVELAAAIREQTAAIRELISKFGGNSQTVTTLQQVVQAINAETQAIKSGFLFTNWVGAPAATGSNGTAGQAAYDAGFLYVCVATNTWKRVAIAVW